MKILILKPSSLGDVVQALPVLRLLKSNAPADEVYWWLSSDLLPLLQDDPDLKGIIPFERHAWAYPRCWRRHVESIRKMRSHRFDWVIDLQGLARSGLFAWLAHGKLTMGLDDHREGARGFYDIVVRRPSYHTHAVDWYLEVLHRLKVPVHWNFSWLPVREEAASKIQKKWPVHRAKWILVHPGARWSTKRWPVEYYQKMVNLLTAHYSDLDVAVLGSQGESALGAAVARTNPGRCLDLTGRTSMSEMIEWVRRCEVFVCNDTGPMHIAAALRKPIVAVFGPTEPRRTGPYRQIDQVVRIQLPCAPCLNSTCGNPNQLQCLMEITPADVFAQVRRRLEKLESGPAF